MEEIFHRWLTLIIILIYKTGLADSLSTELAVKAH